MFAKLRHILLILFSVIVTILSNAQPKATAAEERMKSMAQRTLLQEKSLLDSVIFRSIGPSIMGGRVVDLDVNPVDPTEFYVAYATGGLWYTTNNGQSFIPVFDNADVITIGDIAVKWPKIASDKTKIIWVGTGEVNSSRSSYSGIGVYKSINNGKTWEYLGLPESHHIGKIVLHPTNDNIAWVAALGHLYSSNKERGVYKTSDGGKTWKQTLYIDDSTGAVDLEINPRNPEEIYAAMWHRLRLPWNFEESGKSSGIYKSLDGGNTWNLISAPGSGFMTGEKIGRIGVTIFPGNPGIVYAIVDNNNRKPDTVIRKKEKYTKEDFKNVDKAKFLQLENKKLDTFLRKNGFPRKYNAKIVKELVKNEKVKPTVIWDYLDHDDGFVNRNIYGCEVYRSEDAGSSWKKVNQKDIGIYNTYGYYFGKIFVSPVNQNKVVITGTSILLSTNGGKTFNSIDKLNVHGDHHIVWIDPLRDSHMIIGTDGGCNITYDDGEHWFFANSPAVGQFYSVTVDNDQPYNVYGGLQDNYVWYGPSNYHQNVGWQSSGDYPYKFLIGGDGMQVQVDTRDNTTVYAGSQFGAYSRLNKKTRAQKKSVKPKHELGEKPLRFNWQTPILLSRHNQDIFFIGSNKLYRSLNRGDSLEAVSGDLTNGKRPGNVPYGTTTTIAESPTRFGLLYIGTDDGNIQMSKDEGFTWANIRNNLPHELWVSRIIASQFKEGRVYVTLNGYRFDNFSPYLFVSDDYGTTWKQIGKDLPDEPLNVIREDPKNENILYVGTDGGLYVSFNAGNSFMAWNAGLPKSVPVHDIAIQQRENEIVVATHGRSLYVANLNDVQMLSKDPEWMKKKKKEEKGESIKEEDDDE